MKNRKNRRVRSSRTGKIQIGLGRLLLICYALSAGIGIIVVSRGNAIRYAIGALFLSLLLLPFLVFGYVIAVRVWRTLSSNASDE